jgi:hypothetical protein
VLDAIREGIWDYEPDSTQQERNCSTKALPGSDEKLDILAERIKKGLPLWHPEDRRTYDDGDGD